MQLYYHSINELHFTVVSKIRSLFFSAVVKIGSVIAGFLVYNIRNRICCFQPWDFKIINIFLLFFCYKYLYISKYHVVYTYSYIYITDSFLLSWAEEKFFQIKKWSFDGHRNEKSQEEDHKKHAKVMHNVIQSCVVVRFASVSPIDVEEIKMDKVNHIG